MDGEPAQEQNLYRSYQARPDPIPLALSSPPAAPLPAVPGEAGSCAERRSGAAGQNNLYPKFLRLLCVLKRLSGLSVTFLASSATPTRLPCPASSSAQAPRATQPLASTPSAGPWCTNQTASGWGFGQKVWATSCFLSLTQLRTCHLWAGLGVTAASGRGAGTATHPGSPEGAGRTTYAEELGRKSMNTVQSEQILAEPAPS